MTVQKGKENWGKGACSWTGGAGLCLARGTCVPLRIGIYLKIRTLTPKYWLSNASRLQKVLETFFVMIKTLCFKKLTKSSLNHS
jgi:hypothetical protein